MGPNFPGRNGGGQMMRQPKIGDPIPCAACGETLRKVVAFARTFKTDQIGAIAQGDFVAQFCAGCLLQLKPDGTVSEAAETIPPHALRVLWPELNQIQKEKKSWLNPFPKPPK